MIESVLKDDPKDAEARRLLGSNFLQTGDLDNAATELQLAVKGDLLNPVAPIYAGERSDGAGAACAGDARVSESHTNSSQSISSPALSSRSCKSFLSRRGRSQNNTDIFEDIDARNVQARLLRSIALRRLNRLDEAKMEMQSALKQQPNSPDALLQLGELRLSEKNYPEAERAFRKSYEQDPRDTRGLLRIAEMYIARNESGRAIQILRQESKKHPDRLDLHRAIADLSASP